MLHERRCGRSVLTAHSRTDRGELMSVVARLAVQFQVGQVSEEDLLAFYSVRQVNIDLAIESSRSQKGLRRKPNTRGFHY